jgi:hypothetical protein
VVLVDWPQTGKAGKAILDLFWRLSLLTIAEHSDNVFAAPIDKGFVGPKSEGKEARSIGPSMSYPEGTPDQTTASDEASSLVLLLSCGVRRAMIKTLQEE